MNDMFLLKLFKYNKSLLYYKISFSYNVYINKKRKYKRSYFLKILRLNKYYLIYNKLNLLKLYNLF
jgi:hypothetical protein